MTTPWNAAAFRQNTYRRYKPVAPVGTRPTIDWGGGRVDATHKCCGYHICDCGPLVPPPYGFTKPDNIPIIYDRYMIPGECFMFCVDGVYSLHVGRLTTKQLAKLTNAEVKDGNRD